MGLEHPLSQHLHTLASPGVPGRDLSVEFWARTPAYTPRNSTPERNAEFFSFSAFGHEEGECLLPWGCPRCGGIARGLLPAA